MKKPSLASVVVKSTEAAEPDEDDESYSTSLSELAEVLGVPSSKMSAFKSAFEAAVMSCK